MSVSREDSMPLETIDESACTVLGNALWSWQLCTACISPRRCTNVDCELRLQRLHRFFQFYKTAIEVYLDGQPHPTRIFSTHQELCNGVLMLKRNPGLTRSELRGLLSRGQSHSLLDQDSAVVLIVRVLTTINCSPVHYSFDRLEKGEARLCWEDDIPFSKFIQDAFPTHNHASFSSVDGDVLYDLRSELRARKLQKHLEVQFRPTHDVRNHLRFDRKSNTLTMFHYSAFLKEHLRATKEAETSAGFTASANTGTLPRQLVLEVLASLQEILFPLSDPKSRRLLERLVHDFGFDPDVARFERSEIRRPEEKTVSYVYLANRLSDLHNEMQDPAPRGWLERQLQRKSGARHMLMATLLGVIFAVMLGVASLAVSSYQTWIAYQAWKHPATT